LTKVQIAPGPSSIFVIHYKDTANNQKTPAARLGFCYSWQLLDKRGPRGDHLIKLHP